MKRNVWVIGSGAFVGVLLLAQLVPYGRGHENPPAGTMVSFDTPATRQLAERACFDCHSNRTKWPWYASVAPVSWLVEHDVVEGREKLDFTAFAPQSEEAGDAVKEAAETVTKGEMPPRAYLLMHPEARLGAAEKKQLASGLTTTFAPFRTAEIEEDESRD